MNKPYVIVVDGQFLCDSRNRVRRFANAGNAYTYIRRAKLSNATIHAMSTRKK